MTRSSTIKLMVTSIIWRQHKESKFLTRNVFAAGKWNKLINAMWTSPIRKFDIVAQVATPISFATKLRCSKRFQIKQYSEKIVVIVHALRRIPVWIFCSRNSYSHSFRKLGTGSWDSVSALPSDGCISIELSWLCTRLECCCLVFERNLIFALFLANTSIIR